MKSTRELHGLRASGKKLDIEQMTENAGQTLVVPVPQSKQLGGK
jgi:hypothetical protein